ncbi:MAG: hypothetical protein RIT24_1924, partial [Planctomycetota bacterium]
VNAKDEDGETPLHRAAKRRHTGVPELRLLLKAGADPRAVDKDGKTPHAVATRPEHRNLL